MCGKFATVRQLVYIRDRGNMQPKQTDRRRAFVAEYLIDLNATQAAIRAGYSKRSAYSQGQRLLKNAEVQAEIAAAQAKRAQKTELTAEYVLLALHDVEQKCRQAVPVLDKDGNPTGEWRFDAAGANKALDLIGRHLGMWERQQKAVDPERIAAQKELISQLLQDLDGGQ